MVVRGPIEREFVFPIDAIPAPGAPTAAEKRHAEESSQDETKNAIAASAVDWALLIEAERSVYLSDMPQTD